MSIPPPNLRQSLIDEIAALIFTEPVQARARCYALLDGARQAFDMPTFVQAATQLSLIEDQLGDLPAAINVLSEAFAYAQEFRLFQSMPAILEQLGCCHYSLAHYAQALEAWQQCALLCGQQQELQQIRALAFIGLGRICDVANEHPRAVLMHQRAYQLLLPTGDAYLISMAQINWAVNLQRQQQFGQAKEILHAAITLSAAHDLPHHVAECQFRLAQIAVEEGELDRAESCIEDGLMVIAHTPYHWVEVNLLAEWAKIMARQGLYAQALEEVKRALLIAQEDRFKQLELQLLRLAQQYAQALGMPQRASEYEHQAQFMRMHLHEERWIVDAASLTALDRLLE